MKSFRPTRAEIDLNALQHNFKLISGGVPSVGFLCPMVKADAYGHGDVEVSKALLAAGAKRLGVCLLEEGLRLREAGIDAEILVFRGFDDREAARELIHQKLTPVISSFQQIEDLQAVAQEPIQSHLKFDTGMQRLGFHAKDAFKVAQAVDASSKVQVMGIMTHLLKGDDADQAEGETARQLRELSEAARRFLRWHPTLHALNSAGLVRKIEDPKRPWLDSNWGGRPGLFLYGSNPVPSVSLPIKPVMTLKSKFSAFREIATGETVSYNGTWRAPRPSKIGVIPLGYADGYHRLLSNRSFVSVAGERVPVVGNVCMDYFMVDLTEAVANQGMEAVTGDVVLFGHCPVGMAPTADELAFFAQTIPYEVMTSVSARVPRVFLPLTEGVS